MPKPLSLPFDPIARADELWKQRWGNVPSMAAITSIMRAQQILLAEVDAVVADLLAGSPAAIAAAKSLLDRVPAMPVDDAFGWTAQLSAELFATDEAREGMTAFLEKRPAAWVRPAPDRGD